MKVHEERVFKVPVDELRAVLKQRYQVDLTGVDPYLDAEYIVFSVQVGRDSHEVPISPSSESIVQKSTSRSRKRRRKRNRIKTRGWKVIGQVVNSRGLKANIYEPFVEALEGLEVPRSEQKRIVRQIMIRNGNKPSEESVEYHLDNTLQYIFQRTKQAEDGVDEG
jgi:hypothetical protein